MMKKVLLALLTLTLATTICSAQKKDRRRGIYSAYLYKVELPSTFNEGTVDSILSTYQDSIIKIDWDFAITQIEFELTNNSSHSIQLIWDEAQYIGLDNETSRIFHKGIKYIDRENPQPPTSIYKESTLSDLIAPTSYVSYTSGQYGGWNSAPLIPVRYSIWSKKVDYIPSLIGTTMKVVLPIKIDGKTIQYVFDFRTEFVPTKK